MMITMIICYFFIRIVHLCQAVSDNQLVIVKEIPMDDLTTEDRIASKNEISVLKMLHHPNIIGYYDSFTAEKSLMIVMEYAAGVTDKFYDFYDQWNHPDIDVVAPRCYNPVSICSYMGRGFGFKSRLLPSMLISIMGWFSAICYFHVPSG